jgi:hypothetical protein
MIEVLKELWFLISAIIESGVILYFCSVIFKVKGIKTIDIIICGTLTFLLFFIPIPFGKQIAYIFLISLYISITKKEKMLIMVKNIVVASLYLLVFEVIICLIFEFIIKVDFTFFPREVRLIILLPIRIIQTIILYIVRRNNLWEHGGGVK